MQHSENLMMEYDRGLLLKFAHGDKNLITQRLKRAVGIYWKHRANKVARSRIHSAIEIIREFEVDLNRSLANAQKEVTVSPGQ